MKGVRRSRIAVERNEIYRYFASTPPPTIKSNSDSADKLQTHITKLQERHYSHDLLYISVLLFTARVDGVYIMLHNSKFAPPRQMISLSSSTTDTFHYLKHVQQFFSFCRENYKTQREKSLHRSYQIATLETCCTFANSLVFFFRSRWVF